MQKAIEEALKEVFRRGLFDKFKASELEGTSFIEIEYGSVPILTEHLKADIDVWDYEAPSYLLKIAEWGSITITNLGDPLSRSNVIRPVSFHRSLHRFLENYVEEEVELINLEEVITIHNFSRSLKVADLDTGQDEDNSLEMLTRPNNFEGRIIPKEEPEKFKVEMVNYMDNMVVIGTPKWMGAKGDKYIIGKELEAYVIDYNSKGFTVFQCLRDIHPEVITPRDFVSIERMKVKNKRKLSLPF